MTPKHTQCHQYILARFASSNLALASSVPPYAACHVNMRGRTPSHRLAITVLALTVNHIILKVCSQPFALG